tara:strand:+ start:1429 stop:2433 length:1005 start_codon:yes stop_codon:yes gene_type:complete
MIRYLLNKLRKISKSIGKKEENLIDLITYLDFKKIAKTTNEIKSNLNIHKEIKSTIKFAATITFFYDSNKIKLLKNVCENLYKISKNSYIFILTNDIPKQKESYLKKRLKFKNCNLQIIINKNLINDRLLPWCHIPLMKKIFKNKSFTHFLNLEDDILLNKKNFTYWINARKILKKYNLIPGFIRTEINKVNNDLYAVDFVKKNKKSILPKIKINKDISFMNHKFPYQGMYLYDRILMKEHLYGPSSNPDCGHGAFNINFLDKRMINFDLMAKANIGLTYMNVPKGFLNRSVIPFNFTNNEIEDACLIKHLSNKYTNLKEKSWFGNIKVNKIFY